MADPGRAPAETTLRHRLKRGTAAAHERLEAQLGLLDPDLDVGRYRRARR
jgi:heme oxygenase